jgi:hypothetical protein
MKRQRLVSVGMLAFAGAVTVLACSATAMANGFGPRPCFKGECLDVWAPVLCPDGNVYGNDCYAARACQRNCVPWGGDIM